MNTLTTTDPSTGVATSTDIEPTSDDAVTAIAAAAAKAAGPLDWLGRSRRAAILRAWADAVEANRDPLVTIARSETGLGERRLNGELARSALQFRLFADAIEEGGYLEAAIDHAGPTPLGPGPDVRRMLVPLGPVAVFGSSNFPFAFSALGGDVASAFAAGCPVVVKAHGSHALTSRESARILAETARANAAPDGAVAIVYGTAAGTRLIAEPEVAAVGFTGSLATAKILLRVIDTRPEPIPFYGELSSVNPLIVMRGAAAARGGSIADGLFASFTGSAGQLCTKPGIALLPKGRAGDAIVARLAELTAEAPPHPLLNERVWSSFAQIAAALETDGGARVLATGRTGEGFSAPARLLEIDAAQVTERVTEEAFGPLMVAVRYGSISDIPTVLAAVPESLTVTMHCEDGDEDVRELLPLLRARAGRLVFNDFPTGVRVSWAQHHGGPWPSTNSIHTSVGVTSIRRFLRPVAWQNAPGRVLPDELQDRFAGIPRRLDGVLTLAEPRR